MTDHTPLDLLALRRHILSQFGINLWSRHNQQTFVLPSVSLRGQQNSATNTDPKPAMPLADKSANEVAKPPLASSEALPIPKTPSQSIPNLVSQNQEQLTQKKPNQEQPHQTQPQTSVVNPETETALPAPLWGVAAPDERFGVLGIGCKDWLLLADQAYLSQETHALWQSLAQALQKQHPSTIQRTLNYPLFTDEEGGYYRQATPALLGFLLGLQAHKRLYVGLLSEWSPKLELGKLLDKQQIVPSLRQMQEKPLLKKELWNTLFSTIKS